MWCFALFLTGGCVSVGLVWTELGLTVNLGHPPRLLQTQLFTQLYLEGVCVGVDIFIPCSYHCHVHLLGIFTYPYYRWHHIGCVVIFVLQCDDQSTSACSRRITLDQKIDLEMNNFLYLLWKYLWNALWITAYFLYCELWSIRGSVWGIETRFLKGSWPCSLKCVCNLDELKRPR